MRKQQPVIDDGKRKRCSKCREEKPLGAFSKNKKSKDGYRPDCKSCRTLLWLTYKEHTPIQQMQKELHLVRTYGITIEEYHSMLEKQQNRCSCCGQPETTLHYGKPLPLAVDHCHVTGAIRGLLCKSCNQALGLLGEDPERIGAFLKYVYEKVLW